jgi:hypothetical protein
LAQPEQQALDAYTLRLVSVLLQKILHPRDLHIHVTRGAENLGDAPHLVAPN